MKEDWCQSGASRMVLATILTACLLMGAVTWVPLRSSLIVASPLQPFEDNCTQAIKLLQQNQAAAAATKSATEAATESAAESATAAAACPECVCPACARQLPCQKCPEPSTIAAAAPIAQGDGGSRADGSAEDSGTSTDGSADDGGEDVQLPPLTSDPLAALRRVPFKPSLPEHVLQKGVVSHGDMARMRRFMQKLLTGQAVTVVVIGGSVAWGHGSSEQGVTDFAARFFEWLTATFPNPDHQFLNRAISATPSTYFSLCLQWHVPPEADFVLLEFNPNDGADKGDAPSRRGHERLIRKLLVHRNLPPLIEVVFMHWGLDWAEDAEIPYRMGGDDEIAVLAQYYNLPWVSSRSLLWDTVYDSKGRANFTAEEPWPYFHVDRNHPNDVGHMYIAEMVVLHMRRVLEDLHHRPYNDADEAVSSAPLRPPMLRNNWPSQNNSCLVGKLFKQQVVAAKGFKWVNEGTEDKPKWGYVGKRPNATLRFTVNTATATAAASTEGGVAIDVTQIPTHVGVLYLRSYQGMGMFELSCVAGCTCEPFKLDGWMEFQASQEYHAAWPVSRSEKCVIEARILNETTTSGDHKAKLTGVIVSEVAGQHLEVYDDRIHVDFNDDSGVGEFEW